MFYTQILPGSNQLSLPFHHDQGYKSNFCTPYEFKLQNIQTKQKQFLCRKYSDSLEPQSHDKVLKNSAKYSFA